jgi:hypothetical protein
VEHSSGPVSYHFKAMMRESQQLVRIWLAFQEVYFLLALRKWRRKLAQNLECGPSPLTNTGVLNIVSTCRALTQNTALSGTKIFLLSSTVLSSLQKVD